MTRLPCILRRALLAALVIAPLGRATAQSGVRFERTGYRLTSLGQRVAVAARVTDRQRRLVAGARIRWHVADSSIAAVTATGIVTSRRPGYTKLWAVAGRDSASALILVDQWAARFEFSPAVVRFDAVGSKLPLRVIVRDAAGHPITNQALRTTACRSMNERIATLGVNGDVSAHVNGVTYVRCSDRGIADSVRIEVRQRAVRISIADKGTFGVKTVGDTFPIRVSAFDRVGDEIRDIQATWASLNPSVMGVDPLRGMARAVGPGQARVVAQMGDVTDTLVINVEPGSGLPLPMITDTSAANAAMRVPTLTLGSLYLVVGDTGRINASAKDATGNVIVNPSIAFQASDSTIVSPVSTRAGRGWLAKRTGVTYIVAQFGTILDSLQVSVRAKGTAIALQAGNRSAAVFERPVFDTITLRRVYAQRLDSAARAIRRQSIVKEATGRLLSVSAVAGQVSHSARLSRVFKESRTGLIYGGNAELAPFGWIKAVADLRTGVLTTKRTTGEDLNVTEAEGQLIFSPAPWLWFGGGYTVRTERTELATQRWTFPRASATTRFTFVGGAVTTVTGLSVLPAANYTGYVDSTGKTVQPDPFSLAGEAGIEARTGILTAALTYYAERFTFPVLAGETRRDQFSALRLKVGLQLGR